MQKFAFICLFFLIAFSTPASAIFGYGNSGPSTMINLAKQIQSSMNNNNTPKTSTGAPQASAPKQTTPQVAPKLSDVVNKVFETLRKQEEGTNEAPQSVTPAPQEVPQKNTTTAAPQEIPTAAPVVKQNTTNVTKEVPKASNLKGPSPQCLSVTYQALSILYSFGADAASQDVDQLQTDYTNLSPVIQGINNFCNPKIVNVPAEVRVTWQDCSVDLNAMNAAVNAFQSGDPTNYMNVIQTIQDLWNLKDNFTADCASLIAKKHQPVIVQKPVVQAEPKTCESFYTQAFFKLSKISEDASVNDLAEILKGFNSLRSIILNINQYCPSDLHVNMFSKERSTKGVCSEHFVEMRKIVTTSRVSAMKDLSTTLQKVWNMTPLFLHDC
jgi:hypothetical protein